MQEVRSRMFNRCISVTGKWLIHVIWRVSESHRRFRCQCLSHPLLCCLSNSSKRCLCVPFPLPSPLGVQPSWGISDTTMSHALFLPCCQGYHRNCSPACSPLWLESPEELRSAARASGLGCLHRRVTSSTTCTLTRHLAPSFSSSGNWPGRRDLDVPLNVVQCSCPDEPLEPQCSCKGGAAGSHREPWHPLMSPARLAGETHFLLKGSGGCSHTVPGFLGK